MTENHRSKFVVIFELVSIVIFFLINIYLGKELAINFSSILADTGLWLILFIILTSLLGYLGADFMSGLIHYFGDNYGSMNTPVIGENFIKPFRMHHIYPEDILAHDFLELNGNNSFIMWPFDLLVLVMVSFSNLGSFLFGVFVLAFGLSVFATNQFHKWSHDKDLKGLPLWLQKHHLILTKENHAVHHVPPFKKYYCITTGWLNPILTKTGFFDLVTRVLRGKRFVINDSTVQLDTININKNSKID